MSKCVFDQNSAVTMKTCLIKALQLVFWLEATVF